MLALIFALLKVKHLSLFWKCKKNGFGFNTKSAFSVHQLPTRLQIFNSREGFEGVK